MSSTRTAGWARDWSALAALLALLLCGSARADGVDGRIGLGLEGGTVESVIAELEADLEYRTGRHKGLEALVEARASTTDRAIELRDAWVDYKPKGPIRWRAGWGQKELGWEYEDSVRERLTLDRSLPYELMETTAMVGRDYFVSARRDRLGASLHADYARNIALVLRWMSDPTGGLQWGVWGLGQWNSQRPFCLAAVAGARGGSRLQLWAAETFGGIDPFRTEQRATYGDASRALFVAAKLEYGLALGSWMPYVRAGWLMPDLRLPGTNELRALVGLRRSVYAGLVAAAELELLGSDSATISTSRIWTGPVFRAELRYYLP